MSVETVLSIIGMASGLTGTIIALINAYKMRKVEKEKLLPKLKMSLSADGVTMQIPGINTEKFLHIRATLENIGNLNVIITNYMLGMDSRSSVQFGNPIILSQLCKMIGTSNLPRQGGFQPQISHWNNYYINLLIGLTLVINSLEGKYDFDFTPWDLSETDLNRLKILIKEVNFADIFSLKLPEMLSELKNIFSKYEFPYLPYYLQENTLLAGQSSTVEYYVPYTGEGLSDIGLTFISDIKEAAMAEELMKNMPILKKALEQKNIAELRRFQDFLKEFKTGEDFFKGTFTGDTLLFLVK